MSAAEIIELARLVGQIQEAVTLPAYDDEEARMRVKILLDKYDAEQGERR